jgi:hypothetical protein
MPNLRARKGTQGTVNPIHQIIGKSRRLLMLTALPVVAAATLLGTSADLSQAATTPPLARLLQNWHSSLCLGTSAGKYEAQAVQWNCQTSANNQNWGYGPATKNYNGFTFHELQNDNNSCLGVSGGAIAEGSHVVGWKCLTGSLDQYWLALGPTCPGGETSFAYLNLKTYENNRNYVLGITGNSKSLGADAVIYQDQKQCNNQIWTFLSGENRQAQPSQATASSPPTGFLIRFAARPTGRSRI